MFETVVLVSSSLLNAILALIVFNKNPNSATNRLFGMLNISFIAWSVTNYFSVRPILFSQLTWIRLVLFFAAFLCFSVYMTFTVFPSNTLHGLSRISKIALIYTIGVMGLILTPAVFTKIIVKSGQVSPVPGPGIVFFVFLVVSLLGGGIWSLARKYKRAKGQQKAQLSFILFGLAGAFSLILVTNFAFVVVFHNSSLIPLGSAYTLIFSIALYYSIVTQHLFDIRATVARFIAYVMSLGVLGVLYGSVLFVISSLFTLQKSSNLERAVYIGFALITALLYPSVKKFFDKATNRVFFQDAYDSQVFLDQLNQALVANIDLEALLKSCSQVIANNLKTEYCLFGIQGSSHEAVRIVGTSKLNINLKEIIETKESSNHERDNIIVTDYLVQDSDKLEQSLTKNNVAVLVKLVPKFAHKRDHSGELGYIVLGQKRSGNIYTVQDVQILGIIANGLVIAIQNALHFEEIQTFNITLQQKVDEATRKLRKTNQRLEELDETKDDFISMASHQLRTPLTSVKGYLSMVLEGDAGRVNATQIKMLHQAFTSSQRMVFLITDLLNVSRLKTGKFVIESTPVDLSKLIQEEVSQLVETAQLKHIEITYNKPASFPLLMLDETKIRQVGMNFMDNAIYYTPIGGHINVELIDNPTTIELRVTDNGLGVPKAEQHHLFTKFYRATNARKARPDGTGLGLFMAKKVIAAQGGSVVFESKEGQGSTFGFMFSKAKLKVPESMVSTSSGTSLESPIPQTVKEKPKSLTPAR